MGKLLVLIVDFCQHLVVESTFVELFLSDFQNIHYGWGCPFKTLADEGGGEGPGGGWMWVVWDLGIINIEYSITNLPHLRTILVHL